MYTVNVKLVVRVNAPLVPTTVIVYEPVGAEEDAVIVQILVNVRSPEEGLKDMTTANAICEGTLADRVTVRRIAEAKVTVILFDPEPP